MIIRLKIEVLIKPLLYRGLLVFISGLKRKLEKLRISLVGVIVKLVTIIVR